MRVRKGSSAPPTRSDRMAWPGRRSPRVREPETPRALSRPSMRCGGPPHPETGDPRVARKPSATQVPGRLHLRLGEPPCRGRAHGVRVVAARGRPGCACGPGGGDRFVGAVPRFRHLQWLLGSGASGSGGSRTPATHPPPPTSRGHRRPDSRPVCESRTRGDDGGDGAGPAMGPIEERS